MGSKHIRNSHNERSCLVCRRLGTAQVIHSGAWSIRDGKLVYDVPIAVEQRVKRKVVQQIVRRDNKMPGVQALAYGGEKVVVKSAKMLLRCAPQQLRKC